MQKAMVIVRNGSLRGICWKRLTLLAVVLVGSKYPPLPSVCISRYTDLLHKEKKDKERGNEVVVNVIAEEGRRGVVATK